ncbi:MAG: asparagine synthase (glutamine-hydrolyzing) [Bacteroidales bacterium]|nr:asparagine synthase (glutamine-hydrolyzing) [Bacteroidales bacterium]
MCGITGFWDQSRSISQNTYENILTHMTDTLQHRGPDDHGTWFNAEDGISLGFRRLAILDITPTGHQPMHSPDGRYSIIFNGEIYNFLGLRSELESYGIPFKGRSDTEVVLAAVSHWGIEKTVKRLNGMFAIALWDHAEKTLYLIRDRIGIKPLFYGWVGKTLLFGSELKSLRANPKFQVEINRDALHLLLHHNYIPGPSTIYQDVYKLQPGSFLRVSANGNSQQTTYWSLDDVVKYGLSNPFSGTKEEAIEILDSILRNSVKERMIADVPLGAFLSGGIDSSLIVALMQAQSNQPVRTFSIGFQEEKFNEAIYAKEVAQHLGTQHTELYVTSREAQAVITTIPKFFDEPFADSSQIPTYLVSKLARNEVTVALSGDGGDELFAGYNRYENTDKLYRGNILRFLSEKQRVNLLSTPQRFIGKIPAGIKQGAFGRKAEDKINLFTNKALNLWGKYQTRESIYQQIISVWKNPEDVVIGGNKPETVFTQMESNKTSKDFLKRAMYADMMVYLPDDILTKVDRASMANSLEARAPLLDDHRITEFAWMLPNEWKMRGDTRKWLLKQVLYRYIPKKLVDRPKMGFGVPIGDWIRTDLRDWAETLLDESRLKKEGFFNPEPIKRMWKSHVAQETNWQYPLWGVLMFEAWLDEYLN